MRQLDGILAIALGNIQISDQLLRLLYVIKRNNVFLQPRQWNKRYRRTPCFFPERFGVDFIYYDPWRLCTVNDAEGMLLFNVPRPYIPNDHPTGCLFDGNRDGLQPNAQVVDNNFKGCDNDVATNDVNDDRTGGPVPSNARRIISRQGNEVCAQGVDVKEA